MNAAPVLAILLLAAGPGAGEPPTGAAASVAAATQPAAGAGDSAAAGTATGASAGTDGAAGQSAATAATDGDPAFSAPFIERADTEAAQIGHMLRCPVCQGMPIAESPSETAQAMMATVRSMVAAGKPRQEILDYFVARYGDWVLLAPKARGINLGLWVLPALALLAGGLLVVLYARKGRVQSAKGAPEQRTQSEDPYLRSIRDEVEQ